MLLLAKFIAYMSPAGSKHMPVVACAGSNPPTLPMWPSSSVASSVPLASKWFQRPLPMPANTSPFEKGTGACVPDGGAEGVGEALCAAPTDARATASSSPSEPELTKNRRLIPAPRLIGDQIGVLLGHH